MITNEWEKETVLWQFQAFFGCAKESDMVATRNQEVHLLLGMQVIGITDHEYMRHASEGKTF
jgi:hypothetical protein